MRNESWVCVLVASLSMSAGAVTADQPLAQTLRHAQGRPEWNRGAKALEGQCRRSRLPANVSMRGDLAQVLGRIYDRSPTFRAQCERIAAAGNVRVTIRIDTAIPSRCRAFTIVTRRGYDIRAEVHLPPSSSLTELVAHELEHVLEQIEGLDLQRRAREKQSGVRQVEGGAFETSRAQAAGRLVAAEVSRRHDSPAAD